MVSDSDVDSYKQIKADLDVLRQLVEKSELWVYKGRMNEDAPKKKEHSDDDIPSRLPNFLNYGDRSNSAIDLNLGPAVEPFQAKNYKLMKEVSI